MSFVPWTGSQQVCAAPAVLSLAGRCRRGCLWRGHPSGGRDGLCWMAPGVEKVSSGAEGQDVGVGVREPPETLRAPQHENQRLPSGGSCKGLGASLMAAA